MQKHPSFSVWVIERNKNRQAKTRHPSIDGGEEPVRHEVAQLPINTQVLYG